MSENLSNADFDSTSKSITAGRFELHYNETGADKPGTPILFLHGSGPGVSGWSNFSGNFATFGAERRTIVLDMPGFGRSPAMKWDAAYPRVAAEAVAALLDELGIEQVDIVGNSMGGNVACEAALATPEKVRRMALMGPGGLAENLFAPNPSEGSRRLFDFLKNPTREGMEAWVDTMVGNREVVSDELIDARMAAALEPGAIDRTMGIFGSIFNPEFRTPPLWARAAGIGQPTLLIWGRDDRMLPYEGAHFAFRQLPNAELHVFSKCGHWAMIEQREAFDRLVLEYFTRED